MTPTNTTGVPVAAAPGPSDNRAAAQQQQQQRQSSACGNDRVDSSSYSNSTPSTLLCLCEKLALLLSSLMPLLCSRHLIWIQPRPRREQRRLTYFQLTAAQCRALLPRHHRIVVVVWMAVTRRCDIVDCLPSRQYGPGGRREACYCSSSSGCSYCSGIHILLCRLLVLWSLRGAFQLRLWHVPCTRSASCGTLFGRMSLNKVNCSRTLLS